MHARYAILPVLLMLSLMQLSAATTTVTLTGSCPTSIINQTNNYLQFNLSNSGNGTATNLFLVPQLEGAKTYNTVETLPLVGPGSNYSFRFYMYNFTEAGSDVEYIKASYSQGSSTFSTVFPCLVYMRVRAQSLLQISNVNRTGSKLSVSVVNIADFPIDANLSVEVPATFKIIPNSTAIHLDPNGQSRAVFNLSVPNYNDASFPIVASVSYSNSSVHYGSLMFYVVSFAAAPGSSGGISLVNMGIILIIIILIALILLSFIKKKPAPQKPQPVEAPPVGATIPNPDTTQVVQ